MEALVANELQKLHHESVRGGSKSRRVQCRELGVGEGGGKWEAAITSEAWVLRSGPLGC